jgi:hypothetical protein
MSTIVKEYIALSVGPGLGRGTIIHNPSQWAGAPVSGTPANGPMYASVQCDARQTAYRLTAANTLFLLSESLHWMTVTAGGLCDGAESWSPARLNGVSTATLVCVVALYGCMLLAAGRVGRLQTSRKPVRTPDTVELVRFCGASGMTDLRNYRRFAAAHRAGGAYGLTSRVPAQLGWLGQDENARSGALVDRSVPNCNVPTVQRCESG